MENNLYEILSQVKIKSAIKILHSYIDDNEIKSSLMLLFNRYRNVENDYYIIRMINREEAMIEINSILNAFKNLVKEIPYDFNFNSIILKEIENRKNLIGQKKGIFNRNRNIKYSPFSMTTFKTVANEQDMLNSGRYNIVIVGKCGVGKSELVNYLFDKNEIATGVGKPVTKKGFHKIDFIINGIPTTLYDSWGVEVGKADQWLKTLDLELSNRDIDKPASEWFHTVLYCVAASNSRIEDFETDIINKFIESKYKVVIVFTKSDLVETKDIRRLISTVSDDVVGEVDFVEVCSVEKKLRSGKTEKFGADKLYSIINKGFWESITLRLPDRCVNILIRIINTWEQEQYAFIRKFTNNFNIDKVYPELEKNSVALIESLESQQCKNVLIVEVEKTINMYESFSRMLNFENDIKDNFFQFNMQKIDEYDYEHEKTTDVLFSILLIGIPLIVNAPKDHNIELMEKKVKEFSSELKKDILRLKQPIKEILARMIEHID